METTFPPSLTRGNRVWTEYGYRDHGPVGGMKVDIAPNMGGFISWIEKSPFSDFSLYMVQWDNDQASKHYAKELFCIGMFATIAEFKAAIEVEHVTITLGPGGGFRGAELRLRFDGVFQESKISKDQAQYWHGLLNEIVERQGLEVETVVMPRAQPKSKKRPS